MLYNTRIAPPRTLVEECALSSASPRPSSAHLATQLPSRPDSNPDVCVCVCVCVTRSVPNKHRLGIPGLHEFGCELSDDEFAKAKKMLDPKSKGMVSLAGWQKFMTISDEELVSAFHVRHAIERIRLLRSGHRLTTSSGHRLTTRVPLGTPPALPPRTDNTKSCVIRVRGGQRGHIPASPRPRWPWSRSALWK